MGSSISDAQAAQIASIVTSNGRVLVLFDEDDAGHAGREQAAQKFALRTFVKTVSLAKPAFSRTCSPPPD